MQVKKDGCAVNEEELAARFQGIVQDANNRRSKNSLQPAVGLLTTDKRDSWAQVREELAQSKYLKCLDLHPLCLSIYFGFNSSREKRLEKRSNVLI